MDIDLSSDLVKVESEISQQASLNFDVVQKKYGASFDEIVEIAPFLFSIFAEKSIKYGKQRYKKLKSLIDQCKYENLDIRKLLDYLDIKEEDLEEDDESNSFFTLSSSITPSSSLSNNSAAIEAACKTFSSEIDDSA